ncbi:MAG TPA: hypothetical protein VIC35_06920 [Acidimicrobiia bacterium]
MSRSPRSRAILAATTEGVFDVETAEAVVSGLDVGFFTTRAGTSWALVGGRSVMRESGAQWSEVARFQRGAGLVAQPLDSERLLIGTAGAHLARLEHGELEQLASFDGVDGRDEWKNPAAGGRPDVWSIATSDAAIYVSVHVGGLWRSLDEGDSWTNVLAPEVDVHQVAARNGTVCVAAEGGFGLSNDGGASWSWTVEGLHAGYLQCVAMADDAVYVGASSGPFGEDAAVYRASPPGGAFERRSAGLPDRFPPMGPYHLAADGEVVCAAEWSGDTVYRSANGGRTWAPLPHTFPTIHSLAVG